MLCEGGKGSCPVAYLGEESHDLELRDVLHRSLGGTPASGNRMRPLYFIQQKQPAIRTRTASGDQGSRCHCWHWQA